MKTFEERYTAWVDGQLEDAALSAFEQELTRRAAAGDAQADKSDAARLRALLQEHLHAPALTNPDFFNHQLLARIEAESPRPARGHAVGGGAQSSLFAWGFWRLTGLGAFSLFAAAALYYGLMPRPNSVSESTAPVAAQQTGINRAQMAKADSPIPSDRDGRTTSSEMFVANRSPTPPPIEQTPDIQTFVPDQPSNPTTATPLHYSKPNVNVLWLNGLDYMPNVPASNPNPSDASMASPASTPVAGGSP